MNRLLGASLAIALAAGVALAAPISTARADDEGYQALPYLVGLSGNIDTGNDIGQIDNIGGLIVDIGGPIAEIAGPNAVIDREIAETGDDIGGNFDVRIGSILNRGFDQRDEDEIGDEDNNDNFNGDYVNIGVDRVIRDSIFRHERAHDENAIVFPRGDQGDDDNGD